MKKIPVLGTQNFNSINNTERLIESINYPMGILSVIVKNQNFDLLKDIKFSDAITQNNENNYLGS
jgi:hypothetical protein